jgi:hypothetical protein
MAASPFYDLGPLEETAVNLFHGWGYNFYRHENQLRADDLMVRNHVSALLGQARKSVDLAESAYRRAFLSTPTREKPRLDPTAAANAQLLEKLAGNIGALEGQVRTQPVPENDRMTQRYRQEAATLQQLLDADIRLIGQVETLRVLLDRKDGTWMIENLSQVEEGLAAIEDSLRRRQAALFI